ncbi:MAG: glycoside hydrolase family 97 protein, partial [Verrucomicrobiae bacterium]|nr:glycoside hydrolase family 97 protein [Verrucomicrobiae bacterium]
CELGLQLRDGNDLLAGLILQDAQRRSVNVRVPVLFGRRSEAADRFEEVRMIARASVGPGVAVVFRCYDDAVAFRYEIGLDGSDGAEGGIAIADETTSFQTTGDPTAYVQYLEDYRTSHEHPVMTASHGRIRSGALLDLPLTLMWSDGTCAAITEAALRRYAGMALMRTDDGALRCRLTPREDGLKVVGPLPLRTPWRVVMLADRPGALLESETIYCLNEPSVIGDTSWIRPGKITFPWWNGDVYDGRRGEPILSVAMAKRYIDFCARTGIPTHSMTSTEETVTPWYVQSKPGVAPGPDTDVTRPREGFDLETIREYAESRRVRLWTWVHQGALRGRVEEAFAAFEQLGWRGMMVDFFDHDDQETVEFAEAILQAAARHHLMIHFHGVWKPTGLSRTYPNLMNHEGALNLEYLKWSDRCPPEHDLMMAFTRLIAGPMDYHLGGFRAVPRAQFSPQNVAPNVLGTRCHMLAMYVCFDNPNPMVADYPTAYEGQAGFEFIQDVPTWWDDTRVLVGEVGRLLVTARRKGSTWYVGGLSAGAPRDLTLPLDFLGPGRHEVRLWLDTAESGNDPNRLIGETRTVRSSDSLQLHLATDGGFVARCK